MFDSIIVAISFFSHFLWTGPLLCLFIGTGIYVTWKLRGIQFSFIKAVFTGNVKEFSEKISQGNKEPITNDNPEGELSAVEALMTALAGSVGTGNIAGIAVAVTAGGLGALFWMWVVALFGMATAYVETVLAIKFRTTNQYGEIVGGPMVTIMRGLKSKWLAGWFSICGAVAGIGYAMVQANSVVDAAQGLVSIDRFGLGVILSTLAGWVIIGGVKRIGRVASTLVPFMGMIFIIISMIVLVYNYQHILPAFYLIVTSAFTKQAAVGGLAGSTIMIALQSGAQFGIFANEAGLGSLAIASSCAKTSNPEQQGLLSMAGVFIATMIICTITGLILAVTGVLGSKGSGVITGSALALQAFGTVHSTFPYFIMVCLLLFAFTTILAWAYYGEKCLEFLFGIKVAYIYRWVYIGSLLTGAVISLQAVWAFAHLANGLMAIPNLIAAIYLVRLLCQENSNRNIESVLVKN